MKLKICGMKYPHNTEAVAQLQPDFMGFIFYKKSRWLFIKYLSNHLKHSLCLMRHRKLRTNRIAA